MNKPKLSFCIATYNRAQFLAELLDSILAQATDECEIVVTDDASPDDTEVIVRERIKRFGRLLYFKQTSNQGIDRNFNSAVELSKGEYCWLMPDDDVLKPNAVQTVLRAMSSDISLILVNVEFMDFSLSKLICRGVGFQADQFYLPNELDRLFMDAGRLNGYIGSVVIRKDLWLTRNRERYFGCQFIHLGVIYQENIPGKVRLVSNPCISMRMGNTHDWWAHHFDISMNLRDLLSSLAFSEATKQSFLAEEPWKDIGLLLFERALGTYSREQYRRQIKPRLQSSLTACLPLLIALLPVKPLRCIYILYFRLTHRSWRGNSCEWLLQVLNESRSQNTKRQLLSRPS